MFKKFTLQVFVVQESGLFHSYETTAVFMYEKQGYEQIMRWNLLRKYSYTILKIEDTDEGEGNNVAQSGQVLGL